MNPQLGTRQAEMRFRMQGPQLQGPQLLQYAELPPAELSLIRRIAELEECVAFEQRRNRSLEVVLDWISGYLERSA